MSRYFFKILIGEWKTKLRIPKLFVSSFSLTPKTVILIDASSKNLWKVNMEQEEEDPIELYFKRGWSKFLKDNTLMAADFLIFKFDGNSTFKVVICGKSSCEKMLESQTRTQMKHKKTHKQSRHNNKRRASSTRDRGEHWKGKDPILIEIKEEKLDSVDSGNSSQETWDEKEEEEQREEQIDKFGDINSKSHDSIMNIGKLIQKLAFFP
ncbi:hypothetical protein K1719_017824 [Acacia pycnantha]|nr:hypothetical protein K1719_017824 [Acacia pycnantha]